MTEDRADSPIPVRLHRDDHSSCSDAFVLFLTSYSRMTATPEETDAMLRRIYGDDRMPGTESRRRSQMGKSPREPDPHGACEQCREPLTWGHRFCSQDCWREWRLDVRRLTDPPTLAEMVAEMQEALDRLRAVIE